MKARQVVGISALAALSAAGVAVVARHMHGPVGGHAHTGAEGGDIRMGNVWLYDVVSRILWARMFRGIADDVAATLATESAILEVGCGPGHLATQLAQIPGATVTATDIDPKMIERAVANAERTLPVAAQPRFEAADVAHLPFEDDSFDLVVSTFSMHHWADPEAGLAEIARVLKPSGAVLIWDLEPGSLIGHAMTGKSSVPDAPDLRLVSDMPWHWPGPIALSHRYELRPVAA